MKNSKDLLKKTAKQVLTCHIYPNKSNLEVNAKVVIEAMVDRRKDLPQTAKYSLPIIICDPQKTNDEYDI